MRFCVILKSFGGLKFVGLLSHVYLFFPLSLPDISTFLTSHENSE